MLSEDNEMILEGLTKCFDVLYDYYELLYMLEQLGRTKDETYSAIIGVIKEILKTIKDWEDNLSEEDLEELLDFLYTNIGVNTDHNNYPFMFGFDLSKETMVVNRIINDLLCKYISEANHSYHLLFNQYATCDLTSVSLNIIDKTIKSKKGIIKDQLLWVKYSFAYSLPDLEKEMLFKKFKIDKHSYVGYGIARGFAKVSKEEDKEWTLRWFINALEKCINRIVINDDNDIIDIVYSTLIRSVLVLLDEDGSSDLMHDVLNRINSLNIPNDKKDLIFEAVTARFEDENIPQFVSIAL